jgi:hypothetical protein
LHICKRADCIFATLRRKRFDGVRALFAAIEDSWGEGNSEVPPGFFDAMTKGLDHLSAVAHGLIGTSARSETAGLSGLPMQGKTI